MGRQKATVNSRAWTVLNTSESTALQAIQSYLDVLMRQKMVALADDNLKNPDRVVDQIRLRTEQGVGRQADFEQAQARLAQARNNLLTEQTNLEDSRANYHSVTGKDPPTLVIPAKNPEPPSLHAARSVMREKTPLLKNAQRQLNEDLRLAWNALRNAHQQVPIAKEYADRSVQVRSAYQEQFSLGDRTLLDMLDSENEVFSAQRRYVELQFVDMFTTYRINARTGELLRNLNIQAPSAAQPLDQAQRTQAELPELK